MRKAPMDVMGLTIEEDRAKDHMGRVVRFAMVVLHKFLFHKLALTSIPAKLQSLHAFKGDNVLIYMSKTTMSSVIACLQKATMSSFSFQRRQCLHLKSFNILFPCAL
ncbi:hypothetical protein JHK85_043820 [Glycine max]|nr:hypothetical protein JHK85_043820 [Glycine max]